MDKTYNEVVDETDVKIKQLYWDIAFGLQEVDGLKPSKYMVELSNAHIKGLKTYKQVKDAITSYYSKNVDNHNDDDEDKFFFNKEDARACLWNYYIDNFYNEDDEDERIVVKNEFNEWSSIDGVGDVYSVVIH